MILTGQAGRQRTQIRDEGSGSSVEAPAPAVDFIRTSSGEERHADH
jgi:hypothetical protein